MTLSEGKIGHTYRVVELQTGETIAGRLGVLGIGRRTKVMILNRKNRGATIICVRGTRLALGRLITDRIYVEEAGV